jgi:membrane protein implicated in regulation of membrane protease activity
MSPLTKYLIAALAIAAIALWLLPGWLAALVLVALVAAPVVAYLLLDPSQRRRLRRVSRKQIGR